jgi:hypothetical protein
LATTSKTTALQAPLQQVALFRHLRQRTAGNDPPSIVNEDLEQASDLSNSTFDAEEGELYYTERRGEFPNPDGIQHNSDRSGQVVGQMATQHHWLSFHCSTTQTMGKKSLPELQLLALTFLKALTHPLRSGMQRKLSV